MNRLLRIACRSLLGTAALATGSVCAQSTAPTDDTGEVLESVLVTAQRRAERAQDVPITITNLSTQELEDAGIDNLGGIVTVTPGLRFDSAGSFAQATIRGVGSAVVTSGAGTNVGIYVDGFYSPSPLAAQFDLLNIESIQVLKGPQGTLFGRNTTGGAILVTTAKPSVDTRGVVAASYGNYNAQRYEGYFTTGLTDSLAVDIGGVFKKGDGYFEDIITGDDKVGAYDNYTVRAGAKFDLNEDVWLLLRYEHARTDDPTSYLNNAYVLNGVPLVPGAAFNAVGVRSVYATEPYDIANATGTRFVQEMDTYQLTASFDLGFGNLTSYTQYNTLDAQSENFDIGFTSLNPAPSVYLPLGRLSLPNKGGESFTQEFLLNSSGEDRFKWTAGAFYMEWKDPFGADISQAGGPYIPTGRSGTESVSFAIYADGTYQLLDNLYLTAGLRYTRDEVQEAYFYGFPGKPNTDLPALENDKVTPRVVLRYALTEDSSVYASFSKGYKSAIYNVGGGQVDPVEPESINAYELGYKFASRSLSFDVAGFYYDYSDLQVASYAVVPGTVPPTPTSVVNNAANSRIYGLEAQLQYEITDNFALGIGAAYTDAEYTEFNDSPTLVQCLDPIACGAGYGIFISGSENLADVDMVRAPKVTANAGARYVIAFSGGTIAIAGNVYYTSKFYFDSSNDYPQQSYTLLGLRTEWTDPTERYSVALFGENLGDREYRTVLQNTNLGIGNVWGPPLMFGGEIKVRF